MSVAAAAPAPRPVSLIERVATTLLAPAILLAAERVPLPGAARAPGLFGDIEPPSIVALGLSPFLTAFALVETIALLVPSWRRARHRPATRARLDRFSAAVALALGIAQALTVALALEGLDAARAAGWPERIVVMATLVAGSSLLALLARWVTRRGLVNGFMLLVAVGLVREVRVPRSYGLASPWILVAGAFAAVVATCVVLAGAGGASRAPRVPVPASSIAPVVLAGWLVGLPVLLSSWGLRLEALQAFVQQHDMLVYRALALGGAIGLAPLLNRPDEMAACARRLGVDLDPQQPAGALWRAMLPTLAYVAALTLGYYATSFAIVTALAFDLVTALRAHGVARDLVVVHQERRAFLVPALRAALVAGGVDAQVRGTGTLALLQAFGPYAPAEVFVPAGQADRAAGLLAALDPDDEREPAQATREPGAGGAWSAAALRTAALLALAAVVPAVERLTTRPKIQYSGPPAQIAIVRVDDLAKPFDPSEDASTVGGASLMKAIEPVGDDAAGTRRSADVTYLRVLSAAGERPDQTWARARPWLETHPLPPGDRWAWEQLEDLDDTVDPPRWHVTGITALVLTGEPIVTTADVEEAHVGIEDGAFPRYTVTVVFRRDAAERFEEATREWVNRRIAILVDGRVESAPVVRTAIGGGRATISMGAGDPDEQRAQAERLAASLAGD